MGSDINALTSRAITYLIKHYPAALYPIKYSMNAQGSRDRVRAMHTSKQSLHLPSILLANQSIIKIIIPVMNPFIHLPKYRVIVCTGPKCKYAVLPVYVDSYLRDLRHDYDKEQQEQVVQEISQIDGLIQDAKGLESFTFPERTSPAIPELNPAKEGLQCVQCRYICCNPVKMRDHCKGVHN
jgi:Orsellinic acid/F9775 biosynthesis cluster protein D